MFAVDDTASNTVATIGSGMKTTSVNTTGNGPGTSLKILLLSERQLASEQSSKATAMALL